MVVDPLSWLGPFKKLGSERIIYHFEIDTDHTKIIESIKSEGFQVGIAVNPPTKIEEFEKFIGLIDSVLFMSVNPGFYGAAFIPEVLDKISAFKKKYPDKLTGIDGGVKLDNVKAVANSGVDYICVGSAILKAENPAMAYKNISEKVNG
jgi:ribulose-phosphate 3-epimerase